MFVSNQRPRTDKAVALVDAMSIAQTGALTSVLSGRCHKNQDGRSGRASGYGM